jgi:hypothetical protein
MHFDKKSNNTIIDVKPFSTRNWILLITGLLVCYISGTFSQPVRVPISVAVSNSSRSWTSACTITQSSLQQSHLPRERVAMYNARPLLL